MILSFLKLHWLDVAEALGIFASLAISILALSKTSRDQQVDLHFSIGAAHDRIWSRLFTNPELARIRLSDVDLEKEPITIEEERQVISVMIHLTSTLHAIKLGKYPNDPGLQSDAKRLFSSPIPAEIFRRHRSSQSSILIKFLEKALTE